MGIIRELFGKKKNLFRKKTSTYNFTNDEAAQEKLRELTFKIQKLKEPEQVSAKRKQSYKTASNYSRALRLSYGSREELLFKIGDSIQQLEADDLNNELNMQRVALLREMFEICVAKRNKPECF